MTSTKSKRFNPFSLDAINFLLADVRGARFDFDAEFSGAGGCWRALLPRGQRAGRASRLTAKC